ncbi:hypothetical protein, partial [Streptomyces sp. NPDC054987]
SVSGARPHDDSDPVVAAAGQRLGHDLDVLDVDHFLHLLAFVRCVSRTRTGQGSPCAGSDPVVAAAGQRLGHDLDVLDVDHFFHLLAAYDI